MKTILNGKDVNHLWKVNTVALFKEVLQNSQTAIVAQPLQIMANILYEIGRRATELQDPELLALCARLSLFEESDPYSKEYDEEKMDRLMNLVYPS